MEAFPLLLKGSDEFLALIFRHQHLLFISLVLLLNLHLSHEVVLVFDLSLDFGNVLWNLSISLLLQEVFFFGSRQFWSSKDVLNSVCNDEILI